MNLVTHICVCMYMCTYIHVYVQLVNNIYYMCVSIYEYIYSCLSLYPILTLIFLFPKNFLFWCFSLVQFSDLNDSISSPFWYKWGGIIACFSGICGIKTQSSYLGQRSFYSVVWLEASLLCQIICNLMISYILVLFSLALILQKRKKCFKK